MLAAVLLALALVFGAIAYGYFLVVSHSNPGDARLIEAAKRIGGGRRSRLRRIAISRLAFAAKKGEEQARAFAKKIRVTCWAAMESITCLMLAPLAAFSQDPRTLFFAVIVLLAAGPVVSFVFVRRFVAAIAGDAAAAAEAIGYDPAVIDRLAGLGRVRKSPIPDSESPATRPRLTPRSRRS